MGKKRQQYRRFSAVFGTEMRYLEYLKMDGFPVENLSSDEDGYLVEYVDSFGVNVAYWRNKESFEFEFEKVLQKETEDVCQDNLV